MVNETIFKPVIKELIQYYYQLPNNAAGRFCHIVLDDGNLEDNNIWFCQEECEKHEDHFGYLIMTILRLFTEKEREKMYNNKHWGLYEND